MLVLTENAQAVVKGIADQVPEATGLRFTGGEGADQSLEVAPATAAEPGDEVIEQEGATVFLDQGAAQLLGDKVLDARVDEEGRVEFGLGQQA